MLNQALTQFQEHKVSVILTTYNSAQYLEQCIESIISQTYENFELLICNDCSTDNTKKLLQTFSRQDKRIRVVENNENEGVVSSRNRLIKIAVGDLIMIQDADDWSHPERMHLQVQQFILDKDLGGCCCSAIKVNRNGTPLYTINHPTSHLEIRSAVPDNWPWVPASLMARRELIIEAGMYDSFFSRCGNEDIYLLSILSLKHKVINLDASLYYYRYNPKSLTKSYSKRNVKQLYVHKITKFLVNQFKETKTNWLLEKKYAELSKLEAALRQPFQTDPSLAYREFAGIALYWGEKIRTVIYCILAIFESPRLIVNYRTLFYCLKTITYEAIRHNTYIQPIRRSKKTD